MSKLVSIYEAAYVLDRYVDNFEKFVKIDKVTTIDNVDMYDFSDIVRFYLKKQKKLRYSEEYHIEFLTNRLNHFASVFNNLITTDPTLIDGEWIKNVRELMGLSQEKFIDLINRKNNLSCSFVSQDRLCRIERGINTLSFNDVILILSALGYSFIIVPNQHHFTY